MNPKPCPNPECPDGRRFNPPTRSRVHSRISDVGIVHGDRSVHVECRHCGTRGPTIWIVGLDFSIGDRNREEGRARIESVREAERLWNFMPREGDSISAVWIVTASEEGSDERKAIDIFRTKAEADHLARMLREECSGEVRVEGWEVQL